VPPTAATRVARIGPEISTNIDAMRSAPAVFQPIVVDFADRARSSFARQGEVHAEVDGKRTLVAVMQQTTMVMRDRPAV
jgi:hypothetical protein